MAKKADNINKPAHYTQGKIGPDEYSEANNLNFREGNIVKYITRYKFKGEPLKDLEKAEFFIKKLIKKYSKYNSK